MKAIRIHSFGGSDVLRLEEAPTPAPGPGELLIKVSAAGINPVDAKIREGKFPRYHPRLPAILGRDASGTVVAVGPGTRDWKEGDAVFGMLDYQRGAYAEHVVASPREIAARPWRLHPVQAAALPVAGLTAWQALFDYGGLQSGQRVLIHGAAGGVGHLAVQFARMRGAEVIATAAERDRDFVRQLGAAQVIDYERERFEDKARGLAVVIDLVGGETLERSWAVLQPGGVLVSTREKPTPPAHAPAHVRGREVVVAARPEQLAEIALLVASDDVVVTVHQVFPLEEAAAAHDALARGHFRGKLAFGVV